MNNKPIYDEETGIWVPAGLDVTSIREFCFNVDVVFEDMQGALLWLSTELDRLKRQSFTTGLRKENIIEHT